MILGGKVLKGEYRHQFGSCRKGSATDSIYKRVHLKEKEKGYKSGGRGFFDFRIKSKKSEE